MPPRSVKMKRFIFGFQRRVWWPKWTPASRSSRMETTAKGLAPFGLVAIQPAGRGRNRVQNLGTPTRPGRRDGGKNDRGSVAAVRPKWSSQLAGALERGSEIVGQPRLDLDSLRGERMVERQPRRVQELAFEAE